MAAIGLTYQDKIHLPYPITIILPIAGLIVCYLWYSMTARGFQWIAYWIDSARQFEEKEEYLKDQDILLNPILNGNQYRNRLTLWPKAQLASSMLIALIALLYVIFLCYSLKLNFSNI